MSLTSRAGRALLASVFISGAKNQFGGTEQLAGRAQALLDLVPVDVPVPPERLIQVNATVMAVAGSGLALGIAPRWCAAALAGALVPTTIVGHPFWQESDPAKKFSHRNAFMANLAVLGGLLQVIADRPDDRAARSSEPLVVG